MKVSMHAMSVEVFAQTLGNLSWILEKAAVNATQRKIDPAVLLSARLAPDMLPLTRQVQIASDIAKNSVARLAAQDPPRFEDAETTIEQLRTRGRLPQERPAERARGIGDTRHQTDRRRAHPRVQGTGVPAALGDPERVFPRHNCLRHPPSQRRGPR